MCKSPGHLLGPLPKQSDGVTLGHPAPSGMSPCLLTEIFPSLWITSSLGLPSQRYFYLDQGPEGKDCGSRIFKSEASSKAPGSWRAFKGWLHKQTVDGWMSGGPIILRN